MISKLLYARAGVAGMATILWVVAFAAPPSVIAASHAAKVVYAIGQVSARDAAGSRRALRKGDLIVQGDTVVTGRGRSQLQLTDGAFVALNPNTEYAIEEYNYSGREDGNERSFFNLLKGGVRMVTGAIGRSNRGSWRLRTAVATIGIRGSGGYFRYADDEGVPPGAGFGPPGAAGQQVLLANVYDIGRGFDAQPVISGPLVPLEPGENYRCAATCVPLIGAEQKDPPLAKLPPIDPLEQPIQPSPRMPDDQGPIPTGPAADGIHLSISHSFLYQSSGNQFLNAMSDGEVTDGVIDTATFGSLDAFMFGDDGLKSGDPLVFDRNGATEIVDPTGPNGDTDNMEMGAEWGRFVLSNYMISEPDFEFEAPIEPIALSWIASNNVPDDNELPSGNVIGTYNEIVGGSFPVYVTCCSEPVVEVGTHEITIKVNFGNSMLELFRVDATFPSAEATLEHDIMIDGPVDFTEGFVNFDPFSNSNNNLHVFGMGNYLIFGEAVAGFAGAGGIGLTGAWSFNTFNSPPNTNHTGNASFAVRRTSLTPAP